jgi:hypothetical protein
VSLAGTTSEPRRPSSDFFRGSTTSSTSILKGRVLGNSVRNQESRLCILILAPSPFPKLPRVHQPPPRASSHHEQRLHQEPRPPFSQPRRCTRYRHLINILPERIHFSSFRHHAGTQKDTPPLSRALSASTSILGSVFPNLSFVQFLGDGQRTWCLAFLVQNFAWPKDDQIHHSIGVPSPARDGIPSTRGGTGPG